MSTPSHPNGEKTVEYTKWLEGKNAQLRQQRDSLVKTLESERAQRPGQSNFQAAKNYCNLLEQKNEQLKGQCDHLTKKLEVAKSNSRDQGRLQAAEAYCNQMEQENAQLRERLREAAGRKSRGTDPTCEELQEHCRELEAQLSSKDAECEALMVEKMEQDSVVHYYQMNQQTYLLQLEQLKKRTASKESLTLGPKLQNGVRRQLMKAQVAASKKRRSGEAAFNDNFRAVLGRDVADKLAAEEASLQKRAETLQENFESHKKALEERFEKKSKAQKEAWEKKSKKLKESWEKKSREQKQAFDKKVEEHLAQVQQDAYNSIILSGYQHEPALPITPPSSTKPGRHYRSYDEALEAARVQHEQTRAEAQRALHNHRLKEALDNMATIFDQRREQAQYNKLADLLHDNPVMEKAVRVASCA
ncbi:hypothetical protein GGR52DRAFT_416800 [Hypoxylon sp. FL1284]|nr:hypothetical protein GGR52DRAFT_416800 [Hypoxylon sp. FL1284]